eukprot:m.79552 g.79552  ORF g.79552 m.79552 type:complete len:607 (-) comp9300_c0_seq1:866-2686(-)
MNGIRGPGRVETARINRKLFTQPDNSCKVCDAMATPRSCRGKIPLILMALALVILVRGVFIGRLFTHGVDSADDGEFTAAVEVPKGRWRLADKFPYSKTYQDMYPPWLRRHNESLLDSTDGSELAPVASNCSKLINVDFVRLDEQKGRLYGSVHADELQKAWYKFAHEERRKKRRYCVAQCGRDKCCPSGMVGPEAFEVLYGHQASTDDQAEHGNKDVTLVTQGSIDRIATFKRVLAAWDGPTVALFVIYNQTSEDHAEAQDHRNSLLKLLPLLKKRNNVLLLLYTVTLAPKMDYYGAQFENGTLLSRLTLYPVNTLRNVVADRAGTNWVFHLDMDFVPSATLYKALRDVHIPQLSRVNRAALVVPHFELPACTNRIIVPPRHFSELAAMLIKGLAFPFHARLSLIAQLRPEGVQKTKESAFLDEGKGKYLDEFNSKGCERSTQNAWPYGIMPTNYTQWFERSLNGETSVFRLPILDAWLVSWAHAGVNNERSRSAAWEPFVIVRRVEAEGEVQPPRFSEAFIGRYRNKVEYITHLRTRRFKFFTVTREFTTHVPHAVSNSSSQNMRFLKGEMVQLYVDHTNNLLKANEDAKPPMYSQFDAGYMCK